MSEKFASCSPGGIGYHLALNFAAHNLRVFATARNPDALAQLTAQGIEALPLSVTDAGSIASLKKTIAERTGGRLDYLVNNAGRNYTVPAMEVNLEDVRDVFETNVVAVIALCKEFAPLLIQAKGCIVQIGSCAAVIPYPFGSTYNASKAALHAYTNTLRVELAPFGVRVLTIMSGRVQSNLARTKRTLPEGSLYIPINDDYQRRVGHSQEDSMPGETFAKSVVASVLKPKPKAWIWEGTSSWSVWAMESFLPRGAMQDTIFSNMFHLNKLTASPVVRAEKVH
ncbi:MAG: hypothetical protein Q9227_005088 [Pyrenula ochraceoflavens]